MDTIAVSKINASSYLLKEINFTKESFSFFAFLDGKENQ